MKKYTLFAILLYVMSCTFNSDPISEHISGSDNQRHLLDSGSIIEELKSSDISDIKERSHEKIMDWDLNKGRAATPQKCFLIFGTHKGTPPDGNPHTIDLGAVKKGEYIDVKIRLYNFCIDPEVIFLGIMWPDRMDVKMKSFPFSIISQPTYGQYFPPRGFDPIFVIRFTPQNKGLQKATMRIHFVMGYSDFIFLAKTP